MVTRNIKPVLMNGRELFSFIVPSVIGIDPLIQREEWEASYNQVRYDARINWMGITYDSRREEVSKTALNGYCASEPLSSPIPTRTHGANRWHEFLSLPFGTDIYTNALRLRSWTIPLRDYDSLRNKSIQNPYDERISRQIQEWEDLHRTKHENGAPLTAIHVEDYIIDPHGAPREAAFVAIAQHIAKLYMAKEAIIRHRHLIEKQL